MKQCVVTADRARARLFSVEGSEEVPFKRGKTVQLTELAEDLSKHATAALEKVLTRPGVFAAREPVVAYRRRGEVKRAKKSSRSRKEPRAR